MPLTASQLPYSVLNAMGPGNPKLPLRQYSTITQISKEYAMHTMLKSEIMRKQPKVPQNELLVPMKSANNSLSPHYKRAKEYQQAVNDLGGQDVITRQALVNAKIELNHLLKESNACSSGRSNRLSTDRFILAQNHQT